MVVGLRRNPFGAQALFGYDDEYASKPGPQFPGFGAPPVVGDETQPAVQNAELIEPVAPAEMVGEQAPADAGNYATEAQIEARQRLAKALMGNQQEVNHPMQAIGNAVSQITGAWMESKAQRDAQENEKRRREVMQKAFGGDNIDFDAAMKQLAASGDPELVDKFLEYQISKAKKLNSPTAFKKPMRMQKGDKWVYVDETGQEIPGFGGPMRVGGSSGGGGGGGPRQKGGAFQLDSGDVVAAQFNPADGRYYYDTPEGIKPIPPSARPVTPSTGGSQSPAGWLKLKKERQEGINALTAIDAYAKQAGGLKPGFQRWATGIGAKWKTFLGQQGLTQEQFDQLQAPAKQQALLGMLRTTIVGPGVMTEYDAQRVIQAMGGDPSSALQNPEVMAAILEDLYARKRREVEVLQQEYERVAPTFGEEPGALPVPESISQRDQPQAASPPKQFNDGESRVINGKKFVRKGGRWYPAQ